MNILKQEDFEIQILKGMEVVKDFVCTTFGHNGYNVATAGVEEQDGINTDRLEIHKDGIKTLHHIRRYHDDTYVRQAANIIWGAVEKQFLTVGDGTTTATWLTVEMTKLLIEYRRNNPTLSSWAIAKEFKQLINSIVETIKSESTKITTIEQLYQVALTSANGEKDIAKLVSDAVWKTGKYGRVTKYRTAAAESSIDARKGYLLESGMSVFAALQGRSTRTELSPMVFVLDGIFSSQEQFKAISDYYIAKVKDPNSDIGVNSTLIIFCHSCEGEARHNIEAMIKHDSALKIICVNAPKDGLFRTQILQDIATITGTEVYSHAKNWFKKGNQNIAFTGKLGTAYRVEIGHKEAEIEPFDDAKFSPTPEYIEAIREQAELETLSESDREHFAARLARLTSGSCIIKIGGQTAIGQGASFELVDDAIKASQAAIKHGYSVGGGLELVLSSLQVPYSEPNMITISNKMLKDINGEMTMSVSETIKHFKENGVFDPTLSITNALLVACDVATTILTTKSAHA